MTDLDRADRRDRRTDLGDEPAPGGRLARTLAELRPLDAAAVASAQAHQDRLTKPRGALGELEAVSVRLAGLAAADPPPLPAPAAVAVFAADHGVHAQGLSPWPQEVTAQMVANLCAGGAVVNALAAQNGARVVVVDIGVAADLPELDALLHRRIASGTADLSTGPAMSREQLWRVWRSASAWPSSSSPRARRAWSPVTWASPTRPPRPRSSPRCSACRRRT